MNNQTLGGKRPSDVIASLNTIHGGVMRLGSCVSLAVLCLYLRQYLAVGIATLGVIAVVLGRNLYLLRHFRWFRHWIGWLIVTNGIALALMFVTQHAWWIAAPTLFSIFSNSLYERELRELGRNYEIPVEILQKKGE